MPTINLGKQTISFRTQGEGRPALMIIHGAGCSSLQYAQLIRRLGQEREVVALDLPGHGASPPLHRHLPPSQLLEAYRDVVADLAEKLGLGRFVLAGHSMGGGVAQLFALTFPERVAGLVLMATAARLKVAPPILNSIREHFDALPMMMASVAYSPSTPKDARESLARQAIQAPQEVMLADFTACSAFDLRDRVGEISAPVSIISAADDLLTPPKLQAKLQELIPRSRLKTITRAGHFLFLERPDAVAEAILEIWPEG